PVRSGISAGAVSGPIAVHTAAFAAPPVRSIVVDVGVALAPREDATTLVSVAGIPVVALGSEGRGRVFAVGSLAPFLHSAIAAAAVEPGVRARARGTRPAVRPRGDRPAAAARGPAPRPRLAERPRPAHRLRSRRERGRGREPRARGGGPPPPRRARR